MINMKKIKFKYLFACLYSVFLLSLTIYILLDTFVLEKGYIKVESSNPSTDITSESNEKIIKDNLYQDSNITIKLNEYRQYNTAIYVADITLKDINYLKTAFAKNTYGKNITEKTSTIAESNNAILAINGDYYGVQEKGYVLKNGTIYRSTAVTNREDLIIYEDGSFSIIQEESTNLNDLLNSGVYNLLSFGPSLIVNKEIMVTENDEVGKAMASNPRTAIGIIDKLHYIFVVSDGRTSESEGLSLYELATFLKSLDVDIAYNLDGGGSSTMYFNGQVINKPTTNGKKIKERSISDIVYIGY